MTDEERKLSHKEACRKSYWSNHERSKLKARVRAKKFYWKNLPLVRGYYRKNKEKICAQAKQWKLDNPERFKELKKRHRQKTKDEIGKYNHTYYRANKERIAEKNKEWRTENRARIRAADGRRKKYRKSVTVGDLTAIAKIYERRDWWRRWFDVVVDHITPLSRGGTHEPSNLQIIYNFENSKKRARLDYKPRVVFT